jgi:hypothetical protein
MAAAAAIAGHFGDVRVADYGEVHVLNGLSRLDCANVDTDQVIPGIPE